MANIYELTGDYLRLYEMAEEDIDEQTWFDTMEGLDGELECKYENTVKVMKQIEADAEGLLKEAERLNKRAKTMTNKAAWMKKNIENSMKATGKSKVKTDLFSFNIQKNPAKLVFADDFDKASLPMEFIEIKEEVRTQALKDAVKNGQQFDGVELVQTESLRIR